MLALIYCKCELGFFSVKVPVAHEMMKIQEHADCKTQDFKMNHRCSTANSNLNRVARQLTCSKISRAQARMNRDDV